MAIKAGMTVAEAIAQLTRGFVKIMGRNPDGLEKIKIQQEAVQRLKDLEKVVDMQGRFLDPSKTIMGGTQEGAALRSGIMKATGAKPKSVKTENRAGKGRFTKAEYLIQRLKNTIKANPDDEYVQKNFPNMIKELEANPDLAKNENVFRELGGDLPSNQKITVYDDDTLDFFTKKDPDKKAQGGRAGFFMGSKYPKGLATLRDVLTYISKTAKDADNIPLDLSALDMLRMSNPKAFNKMLEDVRGKVLVREGIMGTDAVRAQQKLLEEKRKALVEKTLDAAKSMKINQDEVAKRVNKAVEEEMIPNIKATLMKDMNMSEEAAQKMAESMSRAAAGFKPRDAAPELTEEGIMQLENILKDMKTGGKTGRDLNASGGRIGFKDGMTRRTFLKIFAGLASIPIVGKIVKPLKFAKGVKNVPIIKTAPVEGKPEWFDQLVNKVIIEGDDMTKQFATKEREIVHATKIDEDTFVRVTQDLDEGSVRVEYENPDNVFGDPVQMEYKKPLPDEGAPDPRAEFTTAESGPVGRSSGPEDYDIDIDEVGGTSIRDLDSDVSKLKEYATGKKPTIKEMMQNKKRKDKARAISEDPQAQSDAVVRRQGDFVDDDFSPDFASGGIAGMLGE